MKTRLRFNLKLWSTASQSRQHFAFALAGQKQTIVLAALAALGVSLLELVRPWPIKVVIDVLASGAAVRAKSPLPALSQREAIFAAAAALVVIPIVIGLASRYSSIALAQVGRKVTARVRRKVCEHIQLLPLGWHQNSRTGDLLMRVMGDVSMVRDIMFTGWIGLLQRALLFFGTLAIILWIDPLVAALAALPVPIFLITVKKSGRKMRSAVSSQRKKEGSAASLVSELLKQIRVVKAFGAERRSAQVFGRIARSGEKAGVAATRIGASASLQAEIATGMGLAIILLYGALQVTKGEISTGSLVILLSYTRSLYKPLRKLSTDSIKLAKAGACAERLFDVLEVKPEQDASDSTAPAFRGRVEFEAVSFGYEGGKTALTDFSFQIEPGSLVILKGLNGAGKTTSIGLILRLFQPDSGRVLIDDQDSAIFSLSSYRSRFAYVPQEDLLFSGTMADNLLFGKPEASPEELIQAIEAVAGGPSFLASFPDGLATEIGENGKLLSGGQKRMISLARAALRDASILVLDEPLESLDADARSEVALGIRRIAAGRSTIIVSHTSIEEMVPDQVIEIVQGTQHASQLQ